MITFEVPHAVKTGLYLTGLAVSFGLGQHFAKPPVDVTQRAHYLDQPRFSLTRSSQGDPLGEDRVKTPAIASSPLSQRLQSLMESTSEMDATAVLASLKALRHQPHDSDSALTTQALLARYAELDPETALTYVAKLGGQEYELGHLTVMSTWASVDPEAASAYYEEQADEFGIFDANQRDTVGAIAGEWATQDLEGALEWAENLSPDVQGDAYQRIMSEVLQQSPDQALALLNSMPQGLERREMLGTLAGQWTHQDPQAATQWLNSLSAEDQFTAMPKMMTAWMQSDPMSASQWLAQYPSGSAKDQSILAMTQSTVLARDPEAALAWSASIEDPQLRQEALHATASHWQRIDPQGAAAWLSQ